jgi:hypothetical protein
MANKSNGSSSDAVYVLGVIGAAIYYISMSPIRFCGRH